MGRPRGTSARSSPSPVVSSSGRAAGSSTTTAGRASRTIQSRSSAGRPGPSSTGTTPERSAPWASARVDGWLRATTATRSPVPAPFAASQAAARLAGPSRSSRRSRWMVMRWPEGRPRAAPPRETSSDQAELAADALEGVEGLAEVVLGVLAGDDGPDPGLPLGHRGEHDGRGEHALFPQQAGQLLRGAVLAGDDRGDGGLAGPGVEPQRLQPRLDVPGPFPQPLHALWFGFEDVQGGDAGRRGRRRGAGGEQERPAPVHQPVDEVPPAGSLRLLQEPAGRGGVLVPKHLDLRPRQARAVDDRRVVQLVGDDDVLLGEDGRHGPGVRREAGLEHDRGLGPLERREPPLQLDVERHGPGDGSHGPGPRPELLRRLHRRLPQPGVRGQPQVVVRRQVDDLPSVERGPGGLLALEGPGMDGRPGPLQLVELLLQVSEGVVPHVHTFRPCAHGRAGHAPFGRRMTLPDRPESMASKASSKSSRANRWVITGVTSTVPLARRFDTVSHVVNSSRPVTPKIRASLKITWSVSSRLTGSVGSPSSAIRPPAQIISVAWRITGGTPDISSTTSAPWPSVAARTASTASSCAGSTTTSAPICLARPCRNSFGSTATTWRAPAALTTPTANRPIGPHPRTTTVDPTMSSAPPEMNAVWTALPNGSWIDAMSGGMRLSTSHALRSGSTTYSANPPSKSTPRIRMRSHVCIRPRRHCGQNPQNTWPSAETNAPGWMWWTSGPEATTCPATSCPGISGGWIRFSAHAFHS